MQSKYIEAYNENTTEDVDLLSGEFDFFDDEF